MYKFVIFLIALTFCLCSGEELINFAGLPCKEYKTQGKIIGGIDAIPGEFPWLVSLTRRGNHFCGGSIITNKHILTAGHCVCNGADGFIKPASIKATVGQYELSVHDSEAREVPISLITPHPEYKCQKSRNDIAILELQTNLQWDESVQPICVSTKFASEIGAIVAGWGWTSENNAEGAKQTTKLQKAGITIFKNEMCQNWYHSQGKKFKFQPTQICAGRKEGGVDACWADSGGPLIVQDEHSHLNLVGIVSTGIGCARPYLPGIYTRISEFTDWIQSEVDKQNIVG